MKWLQSEDFETGGQLKYKMLLFKEYNVSLAAQIGGLIDDRGSFAVYNT